ncbi:MAG TPA: GNAT family N-acetyltransferase [Chitinophaga sp.]|uniref:GNAT family N-acetyltransferase n=1 Tax=Chitinophaga sp. TaxID=1869181 RepID=UPI002BB6B2D5|nr:GNAT family N-acetyltransferase [Chitinophaga sp.]HVI47900.1 GNAT family N-acetyltransferase [Chitinophaga sp.]
MSHEEKVIIDNLFELWKFVGSQSAILTTEDNFKAVNPPGSDWPKRIFDISGTIDTMPAIIRERNLPLKLTFTESESIRYDASLTASGFIQQQALQGMIIDLPGLSPATAPEMITFRYAENKADAELFATIASQSFGYNVGADIVAGIIGHTNQVKLLIGYYDNVPAASGLIHYDPLGFAGLHMIGTLPEFRGKSLATVMTNRLLKECIADGKTQCVLHASKAGEPIYTKLGFRPIKQVITYALQ